MRSALLPTLAALAASAPTPAPAVYWRTSPVSSNQTVLFAGAGFGSSPRAFACLDGSSCLSQLELPLAGASWESSLFFPYPAQCALAAPACAFALCSAGAAPPSPSSCTVTADPNAPEVIFAMPGSPLAGSGAVYTPARTGSLTLAPASDGSTVLRLFGRALAFAAGPGGGSLECVPAGQRGPAPTTVLLLHPGAPPVPASTATCYEAAFDLTAALAAAGQGPFPEATVRTPFGAFPVALALAPLPPSPPPAPTVIDVDRDAGGSVAAALLAAAAHSATGGALVRLGPRDYPQAAALTVPNGTVLQGAGAGASSLTFALPLAPALPAALTGGWRWGLQDLAVAVTAAPPKTAAVWVQPGTGSFAMLRAAITLLQVNVSNALRIEGVGWEVRDSALTQGGVCLWPPTSDTTDFLHSTTLQTHGSLDGLFKNNSLRWQCSAYDLDTSSRLVLEDNVIECTQAGVIPHGNSLSLYDYRNGGLGQASHASQGYFFAHNAQGRPPHNDPADWSYHESLTTDSDYSAGGWGGGVVTALAGSSVQVAQGLTGLLAAAGATALVIGGPGVGQWRTVVGRPSNTTILLAAPFDGHVAVGSSVVAIVGSVGGKLVVDNAFTWGSVVQLFGTTIGHVFAGNTLQDQNNAGQGSMGQCASWPGPFVRWAAIRGNAIGGLAASSPTACGAVNARNPATSDVLVEGNTLQCPPGGSGGGVNVKAAHAVVNQ